MGTLVESMRYTHQVLESELDAASGSGSWEVDNLIGEGETGEEIEGILDLGFLILFKDRNVRQSVLCLAMVDGIRIADTLISPNSWESETFTNYFSRVNSPSYQICNFDSAN